MSTHVYKILYAVLFCFYLGVNSTEIDLILQEHNQYRSNVTPPATDMLKMVSMQGPNFY